MQRWGSAGAWSCLASWATQLKDWLSALGSRFFHVLFWLFSFFWQLEIAHSIETIETYQPTRFFCCGFLWSFWGTMGSSPWWLLDSLDVTRVSRALGVAGPSFHCSITRHVMFVQSQHGELQ